MTLPFIFFEKDFPNRATHCAQAECGFSIRRNIVIQWDEDHDERILFVVDGLPPFLCDQIVSMQEHEGGLWIVWKPGGVDAYLSWIGHAEASSYGVSFRSKDVAVGGDTWILEHRTVGEKGP